MDQQYIPHSSRRDISVKIDLSTRLEARTINEAWRGLVSRRVGVNSALEFA